jgi:hypothetical protein
MKPFFISLFILICDIATAQEKEYTHDSTLFSSLRKDTFSLNYSLSNDSFPLLTFNEIDFVDSRLDTSGIGFTIKKFNKVSRLDLAPSVPKAFEKILNNNFTSHFGNDSIKLVSFIKFLRIGLYDSVLKAQTINKGIYKVKCEIESYLLYQNNYYPAFRIDTVYFKDKGSINHNSELLNPIILALINKCTNVNSSKVFKRKKYWVNEISSIYDERRKLNFEGSAPSKGLDKTVAAFKQNNPDLTDFKVKLNRKSITIVSAEDSLIETRHYLLYSDGSKVWINTPEGFYPLIRNKDCYEYYGFYSSRFSLNHPRIHRVNVTPSRLDAAGITSAVIASNFTLKEPIDKKPYFFDLETGEIY